MLWVNTFFFLFIEENPSIIFLPQPKDMETSANISGLFHHAFLPFIISFILLPFLYTYPISAFLSCPACFWLQPLGRVLTVLYFLGPCVKHRFGVGCPHWFSWLPMVVCDQTCDLLQSEKGVVSVSLVRFIDFRSLQVILGSEIVSL